jgi:NADPH2:quinone reductase
MKAIGFHRALPADDPESLLDLELPQPVAIGRDLLVEVKAVSVNPVDYRVRRAGPGDAPPRVLGYDAAGVVVEAGADCSLFKPGDAVWYAGELLRPGSNSQYQLVDERLVGPKPATLDWADAAAMPLTLITAWEALHEQMRVGHDGADAGRRLLVLGGAGGVGSILLQLARRQGLEVIATASRADSIAQCQRFGAQHVLDHRHDLRPQLRERGLDGIDLVFSCAELDPYFALACEVLRPFGTLCTIVAPRQPVDLGLLRNKALRYAHEYMFARGMFRTPDMIAQHRLLAQAAALFDQGELHATRSETLGPINAANLRRAHARLETTHTLGKLVLAGWEAPAVWSPRPIPS